MMETSDTRGEAGFTLVELVVVFAVIAILSAIALPTFLSQAQGSHEATVVSDIRHAVVAAESYSVDRGGSYVGLTEAELANHGFRPSNGVHVTISDLAIDEYVLTFTSDAIPADSWVYTGSTGDIARN